MRVEQSNILMASVRTFAEKNEAKEKLTVWVDKPAPASPGGKVEPVPGSKPRCCPNSCLDTDIERDESEEQLSEHEVTLRKLLAELLSGRKIKLLKVSRDGEKTAPDENSVPDTQSQDGRAGWGVRYERQTTFSQEEDVKFVASGVIRTADNRDIEFSLRLDMSRQFVSEQNITFRAGDALKDPLVVNFDGTAAQLADLKFAFDLDSDGRNEELPMLAPGSGFLALDLNNDGIVTNGAELFGPSTGNGFNELSRYDEDGNSWIDEGDTAFGQLSLWTVDGNGTSRLETLKDKGIGALYLGNLASQFDLKDASQKLRGQVRNTGIFLYEDGTPGTVQQLDLVV